MTLPIRTITLAMVLAPLIGSVTAGLGGKILGRRLTHRITITFMIIATALAFFIAKRVYLDGLSFNGPVYTWVASGDYTFDVGFMVDHLSALMMIVVTFVSTLVHIYSIGYMADDPGYQRFFCYMSLFTFAMLMLITSNNFLQLFFGWEGVGLVSYLLIGFWYQRETALVGSLKAFLVNRVGDFGFLLGIATVLTYFGTLNYATVFAQAPTIAHAHLMMAPLHGVQWSVITVICLLLFTGAMGKSAQMPLHIWLPESMEGPTPISALIHAATMVTAGIFMVSRMSPLFELSQTALSVVLIIGATGALFTGLVAVVQHDIKRVIAWSTLSQLGYMMAALGASAYAAGMFHLTTHAMFKALLFLAAGSVILAMHHEQDMRRMGGLRRYMPITTLTFLIGALSLSAIPPFAGFYSKDAIIEAVHLSTIPGSTYAYFCVLLGAFVTALYIFRAYFLAFHGTPRMDEHTRHHLKESPWVVWLPLVILAIPSAVLGALLIKPMLFDTHGVLKGAIYVLPKYNVLAEMAKEFHGWWHMALLSVVHTSFWFAILGVGSAWYFNLKAPHLKARFTEKISLVYNILLHRYGFDEFYQLVFVRSSRAMGEVFYRIGDVLLIDTIVVKGSGRLVRFTAKALRHLQSGYLYHYVFVMIFGLFIFLSILIMIGWHGALFAFFKSAAF